MHVFEIDNQARAGRVPSQPLLGLCARSWHIETRTLLFSSETNLHG